MVAAESAETLREDRIRMAGKKSGVNTKFVILLSVGLLVIVGAVAGVAVMSVMRSGERNIKAGDKSMAEYRDALAAGDEQAAQEALRLATQNYGRAVRKNKGNREWITMMADALKLQIPSTEQRYESAFNEYSATLESLARLDNTLPGPVLDSVELRYERMVASRGGADAFKQFVDTVEQSAVALDTNDPVTQEVLGYAGIGTVRMMLGLPVEQEDREEALQRLRDAYAANKSFYEAGLSIARWYMAEINFLSTAATDADRQSLLDQAEKELDAFLVDHPGHPEAWMLKTRILLSERLTGLSSTADRVAAFEAAEKDRRKLAEVILDAPAELLDPSVVADAMLGIVRAQLDRDLTRRIAERLVSEQSDDAMALLFASRMLSEIGEYGRAIEVSGMITEIPLPPLSLEGILLPERKRRAIAEQARIAIDQYEATVGNDPDAAKSALQEAQAFRDAFAAVAGANQENDLKLIDGQLALYQGRTQEAISILDDLRKSVGNQASVLNPLAAALAQSRPGEAKQIYETLLDSNQLSAQNMIRLGQIYASLNEAESALVMFKSASELIPNNPMIENTIRSIEAFIRVKAGEDVGEGADPVIVAINRARQLASARNFDAAREVLLSAIESSPGNARLLREFVGFANDETLREEAIGLVDAAIAQNPESEQLKSIRLALDYDDPVEYQLELIARSSETPVNKALQRFVVLQQAGRYEESIAALDEAERLNPNDPGVIDSRFLQALARQDFAEAQRLATRAAELNIDQVDGLTFLGRLELEKGNATAAVLNFEQATERVSVNPQFWRQLGRAYLAAGSIEQAWTAYERAIDGDPRDAGMVLEYAQALADRGRGRDALVLVAPETRSPSLAGRDVSQLVELWLNLEAELGNAQRAKGEREGRYRSSPSDLTNAGAYAELLIQLGDLDEAQAVVDSMAGYSNANPIRLEMLLAQIDFQRNDAQAAVTRIRSATSPGGVAWGKVSDVIAFVPMLEARGLIDEAAAMITRARDLQDDEFRAADRELGNLMFRTAGRAIAQQGGLSEISREYFRRASEAYSSVIDAGAEREGDRFQVTKRLADIRTRLGEYAEAKATIQRVIAASPNDIDALLVLAEIAKSQGDTAEARRQLAKAISNHPSDYRPFLARAILNRSDSSLFPDVVADLDRVHALRPGLVDAWRVRIDLFARRGEEDTALALLRDRARDNETLSRLLVTQLSAFGQADAARLYAVEIARERNADPVWVNTAAELSAAVGRYQDAARFYGQLMELPEVSANPQRAGQVAFLQLQNIMLSPGTKDRTQLRSLEAALERAGMDAPNVKLLRARVAWSLRERERFETLVSEAYEPIKDNPAALSFFLEQLKLALDTDVRVQQYLDELFPASERPIPLRIAVLRMRSTAGEASESLVTEASDLIEQLSDSPQLQLAVFDLLWSLHYQLGDYQAAIDAARRGVEINPDSVGLNNNLAYTLAKHLEKYDEALVYAQKAESLLPSNSAILDTVGWILFKTGDLANAEDKLRAAIQLSDNPDNTLAATAHLTELLVAKGDTSGARVTLQQARTALRDASVNSREQYADLIDQLETELGGLG